MIYLCKTYNLGTFINAPPKWQHLVHVFMLSDHFSLQVSHLSFTVYLFCVVLVCGGKEGLTQKSSFNAELKQNKKNTQKPKILAVLDQDVTKETEN